MKLSDWQTEEKLSHVNSLFHLQLAGVLLPTIIHPKSSKTHLQEHFSTFLTSTSTRPSVNQNLQFICILNSMFLDVVSACGLEGDRRWDAISSLCSSVTFVRHNRGDRCYSLLSLSNELVQNHFVFAHKLFVFWVLSLFWVESATHAPHHLRQHQNDQSDIDFSNLALMITVRVSVTAKDRSVIPWQPAVAMETRVF